MVWDQPLLLDLVVLEVVELDLVDLVVLEILPQQLLHKEILVEEVLHLLEILVEEEVAVLVEVEVVDLT